MDKTKSVRIEGKYKVIITIIGGLFTIIGIGLKTNLIPLKCNPEKKYLIIELREMPGNYTYSNKSFTLTTHSKNSLPLQTNSKGKKKIFKEDLIREEDEGKPFELECEGYIFDDKNTGTINFNNETLVFLLKKKK